jgi:hypothetical protein
VGRVQQLAGACDDALQDGRRSSVSEISRPSSESAPSRWRVAVSLIQAGAQSRWPPAAPGRPRSRGRPGRTGGPAPRATRPSGRRHAPERAGAQPSGSRPSLPACQGCSRCADRRLCRRSLRQCRSERHCR